ncbi:MAG: Asp-tRNA(Asn)/Glu-tRNA(Gln) amidotransferase subunit GatC [Bacillota bacterium]|nr:Asp-tRNA(Asn)/Glu-tRNA(Gln) amidotransferase subunit GatC [Bacillota bacterium]
MRLTPEQVQKVAELARLQLSLDERERYAEQLSAVLGYFNMLNSLDTVNVSPTSHALMLKNVLRDDQVKPSLSQQQVMSLVPELSGELVAIPRTFEG